MDNVGLSLTNQLPATAIAEVAVDGRSPSDCWHDLAQTEKFQELLVRTLQETLSTLTVAQAVHHLETAGVTALDGTYADLCIRVARGDDQALWTLLRVTADFGQPRNRRTELSLGIEAPLRAVADGPLALLRLADESVIISARVTQDFETQRADQRQAICELLATLAQVCDLRVVARRLTRRYLVRNHRADLPGVSDYCIDSLRESQLNSLVEHAVLNFDLEGRPVAILRTLADDPAETLSYHALAADSQVSRGRIRQCIAELREYTLVATFRGSDGIAVELLPAGRALIERLDTEFSRQQTLPKTCAQSVSAPPNSSNHGRVDPQSTRGAAQSESSRDTFEWSHGRVSVRSLSRSEYAAAVAAARHGGIGLVDHPMSYNRVNNTKEGRQGMWYYDADADRLVVAAEYYNPLQYWVAIARALATERTFRHVLTPTVLNEVLDDVLAVLRNGRNLGYLPDRAATPAGYREELKAAREDLLGLTQDLNLAERDGDDERYRTLRSTVLRAAHGLAGTMIHLLDLADIEIVRELRLPEFARKHLSDETFRSDLATTVALGTAIQSSYGQFVAYRQLFEQRPQKRRSALTPTVNAADPFGRLIGSFAIVGPRVTDLETDLRAAIRDLDDVHEDAPAFAIHVPIEDRTTSRAAFAQATRTMCLAKHLAPTRQAISLLRALTGTPYDGAAALHGLAPESRSPGRAIRPDEIRYALSTLGPERLLPNLPPTVGRLVHTLLSAEIPLSQAALADRADVCTQSIRNHRETLEALALITETDSGLRFVLPFRTERGPGEEVHLPWYAIDSPDRDRHLAFIDVLFEIIERVIDDPIRLGDCDDPIGGVFFRPSSEFDATKLVAMGALPWLRPWLDVIEALLDGESAPTSQLSEQNSTVRAAVLGEVPSQLALEDS